MRRMLFCVTLLISLFCVWKAVRVSAAGKDQQQAAGQQNVVAASSPDVEACGTCHEDITKKFPDNPHSRLALMHADAAAQHKERTV